MEISGKGEFGQAGGSAFSHGLSATDGGASGIFSNFSTLLTLLAGDTGELSLENPLKNFEESAPEAEVRRRAFVERFSVKSDWRRRVKSSC